MKRLMPSGLINFLTANPNCVRADLFTIKLPTSQEAISPVAGWAGSFDNTGSPGTMVTESSAGIPVGAAARTLCCFFRSTTTGGQIVFAYGGAGVDYAFALATGFTTPGTPYFGGGGSPDITTSVNVCDGALHHLALTYDGSTMRLYVDGALQGSSTTTLTTASGTDFTIGGSPYWYPGVPASAVITDVRAYDVALDATAIAGLASGNYGSQIYLLATDGQFDITVPSGTPGWPNTTTTFAASHWGTWSRGAITSDASFDLHSNTMELTCIPQQGTPFPGTSTGLLNAALNGLFDACQITVQTAYMPFGDYGNVTHGLETKFVGEITKINDISRNKVVFECADYLYRLNVKVPTRIIQANCPWGFADANCSLAAATYTTNFTAASGSTGWTLIPTSAFSQATGYFTQGVIKCLTGQNNGLSQAVKLHDGSGHLQVTYPWLFPVAVGDTFSVIAGCDKSATTCTQKFNNLVHFGGMPFVPVPQNAI